MVYYFRQREKGRALDRRGTQISRAGMVALVATIRGSDTHVASDWAVAPRPLPPAAMGSVGWKPEKLHRNDARRGYCPRAVSPPSVYHSGLSQAPHPMHRRRFPFSAPVDV